MRILIAPNAFKNSLPATETAEAIRRGLLQSKLDCFCECFPVADGGDGTADLLVKHLKAKLIDVETTDALGRKITSSFGWIADQHTAIIELADASGLRQLTPGEYDPLSANTFGTGSMIKAALDKGARKILMGIGGSATVDGATGILSAMGMRFIDEQGEPINNLPEGLTRLHSIDLTQWDNRILNVDFVILCDVENLLLGANGAAAIFGPQKGATEPMVIQLESALSKFSALTSRQKGVDLSSVKHGGASGGTAYGLAAWANAKLVHGIDYFLEATGFDKALANADLVITGEGSIDEQTLTGKAPFGVARKAKERNLPALGIAGRIAAEPGSKLNNYFDALLAIGSQPCSLETAMKNTETDLERTGIIIGNILAIKK